MPLQLLQLTPSQMIVSYRLFSLTMLFLGLFGMTKVAKLLTIKPSIWTYNLFLLAPSILMYSNQIRMYQLAGTLIAWFIFMLLKYEQTLRLRWFIGAILLAEMGAYTHYFTALSCGLILIGFIIFAHINKQKQVVLELTVGLISYIVMYMPWSFVAFKQVTSVTKAFWITPIASSQALFNLTGGEQTVNAANIGMYMCIVLVIMQLFVFMVERWNVISQILCLLLLAILSLYGLGIIFMALNHPILIARYLYPLFFCYLFLLLALMTTKINSSKVILSMLFCGLIFQNGQYMYLHTLAIAPNIVQINDKPQTGIVKITWTIPADDTDHFLATVTKNPDQIFVINNQSIYNITGRHRLSELSEKVRPNLMSYAMYDNRFKD